MEIWAAGRMIQVLRNPCRIPLKHPPVAPGQKKVRTYIRRAYLELVSEEAAKKWFSIFPKPKADGAPTMAISSALELRATALRDAVAKHCGLSCARARKIRMRCYSATLLAKQFKFIMTLTGRRSPA